MNLCCHVDVTTEKLFSSRASPTKLRFVWIPVERKREREREREREYTYCNFPFSIPVTSVLLVDA